MCVGGGGGGKGGRMLVSWLSFYVTVSLRVCVCWEGGGGVREKGSPSESKLVLQVSSKLYDG